MPAGEDRPQRRSQANLLPKKKGAGEGGSLGVGQPPREVNPDIKSWLSRVYNPTPINIIVLKPHLEEAMTRKQAEDP
jgi:hypothetical protein